MALFLRFILLHHIERFMGLWFHHEMEKMAKIGNMLQLQWIFLCKASRSNQLNSIKWLTWKLRADFIESLLWKSRLSGIIKKFALSKTLELEQIN